MFLTVPSIFTEISCFTPTAFVGKSPHNCFNNSRIPQQQQGKYLNPNLKFIFIGFISHFGKLLWSVKWWNIFIEKCIWIKLRIINKDKRHGSWTLPKYGQFFLLQFKLTKFVKYTNLILKTLFDLDHFDIESWWLYWSWSNQSWTIYLYLNFDYLDFDNNLLSQCLWIFWFLLTLIPLILSLIVISFILIILNLFIYSLIEFLIILFW